MQARRNRRQRAFALLALVFALLVAGCGGSTATNSKAPDYANALKGAPPPLAALYGQTDYGKSPQVLDTGLDGFNEELAKLKGHPVVANVWGSWCFPCQQEFPYLQKASARFGSKVAFVGIDAGDETGAATTFLSDNPVPYPNYATGQDETKSNFNIVGFPSTLIYDSSGKLTNTHQGPWTSESDLAAAIKQYAQ